MNTENHSNGSEGHQTDDATVEQAHGRAAITAWLSQNAGEHSVEEVATGTGMSRGTVGQHLARMANEGLIPPVHQVGTAKFYRGNGHPTVLSSSVRKPPVAAPAKKPLGVSAKDIEIVIDGTLIVVTRNPANGRKRILIEDL